MLTCPIVDPSFWNAAVTSSGEVVRVAGIVAAGFCVPVPSGSSARYLSPSRVLIWMLTVLALPTQASLTRNETLTRFPSSATPVTLPTVTPATRTSLPGLSPASSVNRAV